MKIKDINLSDIKNKTNWLVLSIKDRFKEETLELEIEKRINFEETDQVLYSAIIVDYKRRIWPVLLSKRVGAGCIWDFDFQYENGKWNAGLNIFPKKGSVDELLDKLTPPFDLSITETFVAAPAENDKAYTETGGPNGMWYSSRANKQGFVDWIKRVNW